MAERGEREGGRVGVMFRFWRREEVRMGLADNSFAFRPRPMTSKPSSSLSSSLPSLFPGPCCFFFSFSFPAIAKSSSSEGK